MIDEVLRARLLIVGRQRLAQRPHDLQAFEAELARDDGLFSTEHLGERGRLKVLQAVHAAPKDDRIDERYWLLALIDEWCSRRQPIAALPAAEPAPFAVPDVSKEDREDKRLKACRDAGLKMNLRRLPDGIGKVAKRLGISRQALSADVRAALMREEAAQRDGVPRHAD